MLLTEEQIKKLNEKGVRYPIVEDSCIGCSACVAISQGVFEMNEDTGKSEVLNLESYEDLGVDDSIMACPVECIKWSK
ncbi:ferredoxin [Candidatus Gracilibacteria bacterium]|nr:ferredoxin [Candidatus Gracilibacteria bacterium]